MLKLKAEQICLKIVFRIRYFIGGFFRNRKVQNMRKRLTNQSFTMIASNCCGAILTHDLGVRFNSPTVNLYFEAEDFVKFCEDLPYYLSLEPVHLYEHDGYPVCAVGDIKIFAMHYETAQAFIDAWKRRRERVSYDNLFIMMTDRDGFHESMLERIAKLPYRKVLFSHKKYEQYPFVCYVKNFKHKSFVGDMFKYADIFGNRYYEKSFDCVKWLNSDTDAK